MCSLISQTQKMMSYIIWVKKQGMSSGNNYSTWAKAECLSENILNKVSDLG